MQLNLYCAKCNVGYIVDASMEGQCVTCPRCQSVIYSPNDVFEVMEENVSGVNPVVDALASREASRSGPSPVQAVRIGKWWLAGLAASGVLALLLILVMWLFNSIKPREADTLATAGTTLLTGDTGGAGTSTVATVATNSWEDKNNANASPQSPIESKATASNLEALKAATVYIRHVTNQAVSSGSGFLIQKNADSGLVATNAHVVSSEEKKTGRIHCIFNSGRRNETTVEAKLLAIDQSADIAILQIRHKSLPAAVDLEKNVEFQETMPGMILGFPFGEGLAAVDRNPAITVSNCSISSLRRDKFDRVSLLQVNGGVNPGNSGGPMLTADGRLIGIVVAKLRNTEIGFVIPRTELEEMLTGRVADFRVTSVQALTTRKGYGVNVQLADPLEQIEEATMLGFEDCARVEPESNGKWNLLDRAALFVAELPVNQSSIVADFEVPNEAQSVGVQILLKRKDGSQWCSKPYLLPNRVTGRELADNALGPNRNVDDRVLHLTVPERCADFCVNQANGDLAGVAPDTNFAVLIKNDQLGDASDTLKLIKTQVGSFPVSIVYKKIDDAEYYFVLCQQDANVYVLSANDFSVVKKIPIRDLGGRRICASLRSDDPYVYYTTAANRNDLSLGVINARKLTDDGKIIKSISECEVSGDGKMLYVASNRTHFESFEVRANEKGDIPELVSGLLGPSANFCIRDARNECVAIENLVLSRDFSQAQARLPGKVVCFFEKRPLLLSVQERYLQAHSTNSFQPLGRRIEISEKIVGRRNLFESDNNAEPWDHAIPRFIADETRGRVLVAIEKRILSIPIVAFELPDEPSLDLNIGKTEFAVGGQGTLALAASPPSAKLELSELPTGAVRNENGFTWTPAEDQIGTYSVQATVSLGEVSKKFEMDVKVSQPNIASPIEIGDFALGSDHSYFVCWNYAINPGSDSRSRFYNVKPISEIAIVPLRGGVNANRRTISAIQKAAFQYPYLATLPDNDRSRVDLYSVPSLERVKSITASSPIDDVSFEGDNLLILAGSLQAYSLKSFEPIAYAGRQASPIVCQEGTIRDGVLYDAQNQPRLAIDRMNVPLLSDSKSQMVNMTDFLKPEQSSRYLRYFVEQEGSLFVAGPKRLANTEITLALEVNISKSWSSKVTQIETRQTDVNLLVQDRENSVLMRVPIEKELNQGNGHAYPPRFWLQDAIVYVSFGKAIYRWTANPEKLAALADSRPQKLKLIPKQTAFIVSDKQATLHHQVFGGEKPYEFVRSEKIDGVDLNSKDGTITLDKMKIALRYRTILKMIRDLAQDSTRMKQRLQSTVEESQAQLKKVFQQKVEGVPVALPVHLKAIDDQGAVTELHYFVFLVFDATELDQVLNETQK